MGLMERRSRIAACISLPLTTVVLTASWFSVQACGTAQGNAKRDTSQPASVPPAVPLSVLHSGVDSVFAAPGKSYDAGLLHRLFYGDLHRDLWRIPLKVEVLRLDTFAGGLTVQRLSGGNQTLGLRFIGRDGFVYQFRSIVKSPRSALSSPGRWTPVTAALEDQMAAQFPLAPMVVAQLTEAVGVLAAKPRPVVLPDDPRLGQYRAAFAGRMGWIEMRPETREGERPGFAGSVRIADTYSLYHELAMNPRSHVDARALLRARLIDLLIGDWDRHQDQWRWAGFVDGDRLRWEPIPRDRDWAFPHVDGALRILVSPFLPQYVGFSSKFPKIVRLTWETGPIDRILLSRLDRAEFNAVAREVSEKLTDDVLRNAVAVLPREYKETGDKILLSLRVRRDNLWRAAAHFYELLARDPGVRGTLKADSATITTDGRAVRLELHAIGSERLLLFDRTFRAGETKEVRLYLLDGDDRVVITGATALPLKFRIETGGNNDIVLDRTGGRNVEITGTRARSIPPLDTGYAPPQR